MSKPNGSKWKSDFKNSHFQPNFRNAPAHEARPIWVHPPTNPPRKHPSDVFTSIEATLGIHVFSITEMHKMVAGGKEQKAGHRFPSPIALCARGPHRSWMTEPKAFENCRSPLGLVSPSLNRFPKWFPLFLIREAASVRKSRRQRPTARLSAF